MSNDILRDLRGFGTVEKWVLTDPEISTSAKALYALICAYAGNKGQSFPSTSLLSHQLSISRPTLQKSINQLKAKLVISVEQKRSGGRFSHNVYSLLNQAKDTVAKNTDNGKTDDSNSDDSNTDDNEVYTKNNSVKNNSVKSNSSNALVASKDAQREQIEKIVEIWNQIEGLPQVRKIAETSKRYKYASARLKEEGFDTVVDVVQKVASSDFLRGKNRNNWTANFEWAMTASNFIKILEDTYINKESNHEAGRANNSADKLERIYEEGQRAIEEFDFENFDGTF